MIRRAGLVALFVMLLSATSVSAATKTIDVQNYSFTPSGPKIARGTSVSWHNLSNSSHTATSDVPGIWNSVSIPASGTSASVTFNQAGSFLYHCAVHPSTMKGKIKVPMSASPSTGTTGTIFTLTLGNAPIQAGFTHEIAISRNGGTFTNLTPTSNTTTTFKATLSGTYRFHTRLRNGGQSPTAWSPTVSITVN